ncbi:effector-binding domain-containing protein [Tenacibaculum sp. MAR_2009_124]|uniref:GyrI-like domain-containing protein n=1 Tax=Tenacibaculum sp. MAR_2009_124 TaxID=1250059 RepID=UPI000897D315|nr:GyrI-like domain-containing protein [Tenacibaculum sp. MAR_2009_124]SEC19497.1 effector-binding domain-containing protein [Tenacibaculum sp. MAR_2009_124]
MKKIWGLVAMLLLAGLLWYLLIKPYDYLVTFKVKTTTGTINQSLKSWNKTLKDNSSLEQIELGHLLQKVSTKDSLFTFDWNMERLNDSISKVKIYVTDENNSIQNKIAIPFTNTNFEKRVKKTVSDFFNGLTKHLSEIKVSEVQKSNLKETYCAYVNIKGRQHEKAFGMMKYYSFLSGFLNKNNIDYNGLPFVEIKYWDIEKDSIHFNFCFPIIKNDSLPNHPEIQYKQNKSVNALKVIYNGNYITSDRAWYKLLNYAERNKITISRKPVEIFHNNPNYGGDALRWKTEVYMPIEN